MNTLNWNKRRYTLYAPFYDFLVKPLEHGRRTSIEMLNVQSGERVLLLGVGTGADLPFLPPQLKLTAIDLTPAMVQRSLNRSQALGQDLQAAVMNAQDLGFDAGSFDAILLHLVLAVVPDPAACIREAVRVLHPQGRIAIFDKFLPNNTQASATRRLLNTITTTLFSDINRQLEPLLELGNLQLTSDRPVGFNGAYRVALASKS